MFTLVQNNVGGSTAEATNLSVTAPKLSGNGPYTVIGVVTWDSSSPITLSSITDDANNVYNILDNIKNTKDEQTCANFIAENLTNSPNSVMATFSGATQFRAMSWDLFKGVMANTLALDSHSVQTQNSVTVGNSGNISTTSNGDLIWVGSVNFSDGLPMTNGTGFTLASSSNAGGVYITTEYMTQNSSGSLSGSVNLTDSGDCTTFIVGLRSSNAVIPAPKGIFTPMIPQFYRTRGINVSNNSSNGTSNNSNTITISGNVVLWAMDGEEFSNGVMTNNFFARNGYVQATNTTATANFGKSWDDPNFWLTRCFYGVYTDVIPQFLELNLTASTGVAAANTAEDIGLLANTGIATILNVGSDTGPEDVMPNSSIGIWKVAGFHVDESDPSPFIQGFPNALQDGYLWDLAGTWNIFPGDNINNVPMTSLLGNGSLYTTPNGTKKGLAIFGADLYWFADGGIDQFQGADITDPNGPNFGSSTTVTQDQMKRGSNYGNMIDFYRFWSTGTDINGLINANVSQIACPSPGRILFTSYIENNSTDLTGGVEITPQEQNWAVWSSLIHGARAIDYFTVAFGHNGGFDNTTVVDGITMFNQAVITNGLILSLAPILNSPFALNYANVTPFGYSFPTYQTNWFNGGIEFMVKKYSGAEIANNGPIGIDVKPGYYIFATTRNSESVTNTVATFILNDNSATSINVINENRSISVANGKFQDTFQNAWTTRVYQVVE